MKKIFQIAIYDFKRLIANPYTITTMIAVFIALIIWSSCVKIPTAPVYKANLTGATVAEVYADFKSNNAERDTQNKLDGYLRDANLYIENMQKTTAAENLDIQTINTIKSTFSELEKNLKVYMTPGEYGETADKNAMRTQLNDGSTALTNLVNNFKRYDKFESCLFFTKSQFATLEKLEEFYRQTKAKSDEEAFDELGKHTSYFKTISQISTGTFGFDEEQLQAIKSTYISPANTKKNALQTAIESFYSSNRTSNKAEDTNKLRNLITNYKLTCESVKTGVVYELELIIFNHFHQIDSLYGFQSIIPENHENELARIQYFLNDESLNFTQGQEPLNFNSASYAASAYDHAYYVLSILGFLNILFAIFCAYKLFGRDRRNGKMDVILSQDVTFGQTFAGKFTAVVFISSFIIFVFTIFITIGAVIFFQSLPGSILAVFNLSTPYSIHPFLFLIIKMAGYELQAIFYATLTIFLMNCSRRFDLMFIISLLIYAIATICNIYLNGTLIYCLLPFIHADLTSFLGGGTMATGFLKTSLYTYGNFFISLAYYLVVIILFYNLTNQLFKRN